MGKSEGLFKALPATRFYGSKRKHLDWLAACLKGYEYDSVLDMFGGTGAVSMMFERLGKRATYHDSARFNYRQAKALFGEPKSFDFQLIEDMLHSVRPEKGFISSAFDRAYFTRRENNWLDGYVVLDRSIADDINRDALFIETTFIFAPTSVDGVLAMQRPGKSRLWSCRFRTSHRCRRMSVVTISEQ